MPTELEQAADQHAAILRACVKEAQKPMELSFGAKSGRLRRNSPCPCGSGRKYKTCCIRRVDGGEYHRLTINGPVDPKNQPATKLGPSRGVVRYVRRKIAEQNAQANAAAQVVANEDPVEHTQNPNLP